MADKWQGVDIPSVPIVGLKDWQKDVYEIKKWIEGLCRGIATVLDDPASSLPLGGVMPSEIIVRVGDEGRSKRIARADHEHPCLTLGTGGGVDLSDEIPVAETADVAGNAGEADEASRADHVHALECDVPVEVGVVGTLSEGVSTKLARADHVHIVTLLDQDISRLDLMLREHDRYGLHSDITVFALTTGAVSGTLGVTIAPSIGQAVIMKVFPRAWLHSKYIHFGWLLDMVANPDPPYTGAGQIWAEIRDGQYYRSSNSDFPAGSDIALKGNGILQTLATRYTDDGAVFHYVGVQADIDHGNQEFCTLMFRVLDGLSGVQSSMSINWIEIRDANDLEALYSEYFMTGAVLKMETSGGGTEYGYVVS